VEQEHKNRPVFLGNSPAISQIKRTIRLLARTNASVLIEGESGTGKEVVAKSIHQESGRTGRLVCVNCGAIPESLLESELFGYEKGAFTGAVTAKAGLFESASKGTLFLDEIGDMPLSLQVKLLRVLQDGSFFRLGSTEPMNADVRVVAATNSDLKSRIGTGQFREDLYYRLNVVSLFVPPLRDRKEDISLLAEHFLVSAKEAYGKRESALTKAALEAMEAYDWPGNIRELRNLIERTLVVTEDGEIGPRELGLAEAVYEDLPAAAMSREIRFTVGTSLQDMELEAIRATLAFTGGDKGRAAEILGINQRTIYRKLAKTEADESEEGLKA
jgi:transcriptional regulator with PAS, ATPase and Fis domain